MLKAQNWSRKVDQTYDANVCLQRKLVRVIDGDTIDAVIDLGFDVWVRERVRLYGINTPETRARDLMRNRQVLQLKTIASL